MQERILVPHAVKVVPSHSFRVSQRGQPEHSRRGRYGPGDRRTPVLELVAKDLTHIGQFCTQRCFRSSRTTRRRAPNAGSRWTGHRSSSRGGRACVARGHHGRHLVPPVGIPFALDRASSSQFSRSYARLPAHDILQPLYAFLQVLELVARDRGTGNLGTGRRDGTTHASPSTGRTIGIAEIAFLLALATEIAGRGNAFAAGYGGHWHGPGGDRGMTLVVAMAGMVLEVGESRSIGDGKTATDQVGKRLLIGEMGEKGRMRLRGCCSSSSRSGRRRKRKRRG